MSTSGGVNGEVTMKGRLSGIRQEVDEPWMGGTFGPATAEAITRPEAEGIYRRNCDTRVHFALESWRRGSPVELSLKRRQQLL